MDNYIRYRPRVGNAGQIPSSGAIQFNHFRGTNGSASSSNLVCYGFKFYQTKVQVLHQVLQDIYLVILQGHYGTSYQSGANWTNVPFRWIDSPAKNGLTASRWYGSDTHANNGMNTGKLNCIHETCPNIGATTSFIYNTNNNTNS